MVAARFPQVEKTLRDIGSSKGRNEDFGFEQLTGLLYSERGQGADAWAQLLVP